MHISKREQREQRELETQVGLWAPWLVCKWYYRIRVGCKSCNFKQHMFFRNVENGLKKKEIICPRYRSIHPWPFWEEGNWSYTSVIRRRPLFARLFSGHSATPAIRVKRSKCRISKILKLQKKKLTMFSATCRRLRCLMMWYSLSGQIVHGGHECGLYYFGKCILLFSGRGDPCSSVSGPEAHARWWMYDSLHTIHCVTC